MEEYNCTRDTDIEIFWGKCQSFFVYFWINLDLTFFSNVAKTFIIDKQQKWQWQSIFTGQENTHLVQGTHDTLSALLASKINQTNQCYDFAPNISLLKAVKSAIY